MRIGVTAVALLASGSTRADFVATTVSVAATVVATCRIDAKQVMASLRATPGHTVVCAFGALPYGVPPTQPAVAVEQSADRDIPLLIVTF